ncbi:MAG: hypothetical protein KA303_01060 [Paludibacter sp.]|jgi:hypothetical protein|nr:hypothetical protein [Paludibacter sp.]
MKKLNCPQCKINRFGVRNGKGESVVVTVNDAYEIIPIHPEESLEGFDLSIVYCLGCSWSGSPRNLSHKH